MTIDAIWAEMESEPSTGTGWTTRLASPHAGHPVHAAIDPSDRSRALLVETPVTAIPPRQDWPECRGLELLALKLGSVSYLAIRLRESACREVFSILADDIVPRAVGAATPQLAVEATFGRLQLWQHFLRSLEGDMSLQTQRGLVGELWALHRHFVPACGPARALEGWKADSASHQDFQFPAGSVEVKTTTAKQPAAVRITSERQLDTTGTGHLFLHVVVLDERDVPAAGGSSGFTLPGLVDEVNAALSPSPVLTELFRSKLLTRGWLDARRSRYESRRWSVRTERTFEVRDGFPRIVESDVPNGVGEVSYALNLPACESFAVPVAECLSAVLVSP